MNNHIKHIGLILLMVIFIPATSGIYITLHQCHSTGHHSIHIMDTDPDCNHEECCHNTESNHTNRNTSSSGQSNPFHCSNKSQHIAIKNEFVHSSYQIDLSPLSFDLFDAIPLHSDNQEITQTHSLEQNTILIRFLSLYTNKKYTCLLI